MEDSLSVGVEPQQTGGGPQDRAVLDCGGTALSSDRVVSSVGESYRLILRRGPCERWRRGIRWRAFGMMWG
ncbi:hypothetical protein E6C67_18820 [Azospirillum sp. TSA2s]|nr:hypothetical protein E6C67_18820 [Azospirillum sp. TSA2s]